MDLDTLQSLPKNLQRIFVATLKEVLKKLFRVFDVNSDGSISIKEMKRLVKDLYGLLKHNDPTQASEEFIANTAFAEMDSNRDGLVSKV